MVGGHKAITPVTALEHSKGGEEGADFDPRKLHGLFPLQPHLLPRPRPRSWSLPGSQLKCHSFSRRFLQACVLPGTVLGAGSRKVARLLEFKWKSKRWAINILTRKHQAGTRTQ